MSAISLTCVLNTHEFHLSPALPICDCSLRGKILLPCDCHGAKGSVCPVCCCTLTLWPGSDTQCLLSQYLQDVSEKHTFPLSPLPSSKLPFFSFVPFMDPQTGSYFPTLSVHARYQWGHQVLGL